MAYPNNLDSLANPVNGEVIDVARISTAFDAVEALERRTFRNPISISAPYVAVSARTARSFAHKAVQFTPGANMSLFGVRACIQTPAAAITVHGSVFTVSGGVVATVTLTDVYTNTNASPGVLIADLLFAAPVALTSGTLYGLGVGYQSSAGSATTTGDFPAYILPRDFLANSLPRCGTWGSASYHMSTFTPAVSTAVTTSASDQASGASAYAITPLFDWA